MLFRTIALIFWLPLALLRAAITPVKTNPAPIGGINQTGAMVPNDALVPALASLAQNAAPAFGNFALSLIPNSLAATTYSGNQIVGGIIRRNAGGTGATIDSTDTATNIVNAIPGATVGQSFTLELYNMGSGALTMAAGAGVTLAGTNVIGGFQMRKFFGQVLGSAAVTMTNIASFSLSSSL